LLRRAFDDAQEAVVLGSAQRAALGDLDGVALVSLVLLVVSMQHGAALKVLAVLGVPHLVLDDDLDRLVRLVGGDHAADRPQQRTFDRASFGRRFLCCCLAHDLAVSFFVVFFGSVFFGSASAFAFSSRSRRIVFIRAISVLVLRSWLGS